MSETSQKPNPNDRAPRVEYELPVAYSSVTGFVTDWAVNLSRGGLYINTDKPLPVDTVVRLLVTLPGAHFPVELKGRVTRTNALGATTANQSPGMAVEFVDVDDEKRSRIGEFVERLRSEFPPEDDVAIRK
ncbi:TIGR02266 family protein [Pyxidicoccus parkwayensis]|uniref:TIGR02266 family protein n=1 Tax=Pyxidicoccus parkwayensis TaxID=2813578 RepID=A0ABX7P6Y7_9BACT|nr:TIGR02266 family protein [Pyxidicoccus parkwaysis]QSQ26172.1 TIGR02266 family protein [Pyxidicoccus parkwaysis]